MANQKNLEFCNNAIALKKNLEKSFINLGQYLHEIKEKSLWEANWSSWDEYCLELKMSRNSINKLIQIYSTFVLDYNIGPEKIATAGGWTVVSELLPVIETREQAIEWIHKAQELTREDLRKEVTEAKSGVQQSACKHKNTYTIVVCRACGIRMEDHKEHEN